MKNTPILNLVWFIILSLAISSCIGTSNKIHDPLELVEKYLKSKSWQDRLLYVLDSSTVKPLMAKYYEKSDFSIPTKFKNLRRIIDNSSEKANADSVQTISVSFSNKNAFGVDISREVIYYIVKTENGLKIDWPGSVGYNPMKLNVYMATMPKNVMIFRLYCRLSDYYNHGYIHSQGQCYAIECTNEDGYPRIYSYILKKSVDGQKLFEILKDGEYHRITLAIKYDRKSEGSSSIATISKLISDSWYVAKSANTSIVEAEELSENFTNILTGHIFLSDDIIYSLNFIEENEVVVSIYEFGNFQQPYTVEDSIIDIKLWETPLQYKILNKHQLRLIAAPHLSANEKGKSMELRK